MLQRLLICGLIAVCCAAVTPVAGAAETKIEKAASKLLATTVTIRISPNSTPQPQAKPDTAANSDAAAEAAKRADLIGAAAGVTVCSGTSLGKGLIVTCRPALAGEADSKESFTYRATLADGEQAAAEPAVVDTYTGLVLLRIKRQDLPGLAMADQLPKIGGTVLTASASGIDKPLVSMGVLSGTDRSIRGVALPPLIQCDISTTEASSGSAIVDPEQRLVGVIVATGTHNERFGWSYAVPYRYVRRVLDAQVQDRLVVLVRRRPSVGLKLGPGKEKDTVVVERVVPGGPADQAGIKQGDLVIEAEGRKIRSAYQAVVLVLKRQPGEEFALVVDRGGNRQNVKVTLGGSAGRVTNLTAVADHQVEIGPRLNVRVAGPNRIELRNRAGVQELSVQPQTRSPGNEVELLRAQLKAYQRVIEAQQKELLERKATDQSTREQLELLRREIANLKKRVDDGK